MRSIIREEEKNYILAHFSYELIKNGEKKKINNKTQTLYRN